MADGRGRVVMEVASFLQLFPGASDRHSCSFPARCRGRRGIKQAFPFLSLICLIQAINIGIPFQLSDNLRRCTPESRKETEHMSNTKGIF